MPGKLGQTGQGRQVTAGLESQAGQVCRAIHVGAVGPCGAGQACYVRHGRQSRQTGQEGRNLRKASRGWEGKD